MIHNAVCSKERKVLLLLSDNWIVLYNVQCQIELPKLLSELESNQLVTSSLLAELNYFLDVQHELIDNYRAAYTAGNTSLEDAAYGIPYDVITDTIGTKKVCYFTSLVFCLVDINVDDFFSFSNSVVTTGHQYKLYKKLYSLSCTGYFL